MKPGVAGGLRPRWSAALLAPAAAVLLSLQPLQCVAGEARAPGVRRGLGRSRRLVYSYGGNSRNVTEEAARQRYPFLVSLLWDGSHVCGGSLLNPWWVLTAAHCISTSPQAVQHYTVTGNKTNVTAESPGKWTRVVDLVVVYPGYLAYEVRFDIALVRLKDASPVTSGFTVLANASFQYKPPMAATIVGWGSVDSDCFKYQDMLLEGDTRIVDSSYCKKDNQFYNRTVQVCCENINTTVQNISGTGCGDSGGPLLVTQNGIAWQVGIVSYTTEARDTFTRVGGYLDWISQVMANPPSSSLMVPPTCYNGCCDSPAFFLKGMGCGELMEMDCMEVGSLYGFTDEEVEWMLGNCSATCGVCPDCDTTNGGCCDDPFFLDADGDPCIAWQDFEDSCRSVARKAGYTTAEVNELLDSCPVSCGLCMAGTDCLDALSFRDELQYICADWQGSNCSTAVEVYNYSRGGQADLLQNCPRTCGRCPKGAGAGPSRYNGPRTTTLTTTAMSNTSAAGTTTVTVAGSLSFAAMGATQVQVETAVKQSLLDLFSGTVVNSTMRVVAQQSRRLADGPPARRLMGVWSANYTADLVKQAGALATVLAVAGGVAGRPDTFATRLYQALVKAGADEKLLDASFDMLGFTQPTYKTAQDLNADSAVGLHPLPSALVVALLAALPALQVAAAEVAPGW